MKYEVKYRSSDETNDDGGWNWYESTSVFDSLEDAVNFCIRSVARSRVSQTIRNELEKKFDEYYVSYRTHVFRVDSIKPYAENVLTTDLAERINVESKNMVESVIKETVALESEKIMAEEKEREKEQEAREKSELTRLLKKHGNIS